MPSIFVTLCFSFLLEGPSIFTFSALQSVRGLCFTRPLDVAAKRLVSDVYSAGTTDDPPLLVSPDSPFPWEKNVVASETGWLRNLSYVSSPTHDAIHNRLAPESMKIRPLCSALSCATYQLHGGVEGVRTCEVSGHILTRAQIR